MIRIDHVQIGNSKSSNKKIEFDSVCTELYGGFSKYLGLLL